MQGSLLQTDQAVNIPSLMPQGWRQCETPKTLKAMIGKHMLLLVNSPFEGSPIRAGCQVKVHRATNEHQLMHSCYGVPRDMDLGPGKRLLLCAWECERCAHTHTQALPHIWLQKGHLIFITMIN